MPSKEYLIGGEFDEELFSELRENRLASLLSSEVAESEKKWLVYGFEEAQVKIDITDMILEDMIEEITIKLEERSEYLANQDKGKNFSPLSHKKEPRSPTQTSAELFNSMYPLGLDSEKK